MNIWITIITIFISTTVLAAEPVKVKPPANKSLSSENGRYVYGQISEMRRDQYMLDTKTGKLWNLMSTFTGEGANREEATYLVPVLYKQHDGTWLWKSPDER